MELHSLTLAASLAQRRIENTRDALPQKPKGRGKQLYRLIDQLLDRALFEIGRTAFQAADASDPERQTLLRRLIRINDDLRFLYSLLAPYLQDLSRKDVKVGLFALIDELVPSLLPDGADAVVHISSDNRGYSTIAPIPLIQRYLRILRIPWPADEPVPVGLNIPSLDADNALLTPILAHEIGHPAVTQRQLIAAVETHMDRAALNTLFAMRLSQAGSSGSLSTWRKEYVFWLEESLCDALATVLMGPSFLFASIAELPAGRPGSITAQLNTHPFSADRLQLVLELLELLGWKSFVETRTPETFAWVNEILSTNPPSTNPHELFLREAFDLARKSVCQVAMNSVTNGLTPSTYGKEGAELEEHLAAGVPPGTKDATVSMWSIVLAGWMNWLTDCGESGWCMSEAIADRDYNRFVMKGLEIRSLVKAWA